MNVVSKESEALTSLCWRLEASDASQRVGEVMKIHNDRGDDKSLNINILLRYIIQLHQKNDVTENNMPLNVSSNNYNVTNNKVSALFMVCVIYGSFWATYIILYLSFTNE